MSHVGQLCARPTGGSNARTTRGPAQRRGAQRESRVVKPGRARTTRQTTHPLAKGRDALKHNSEPGHLGSCIAYRGAAMQEFSEVRAVARRNCLYQILAINVADRGVAKA